MSEPIETVTVGTSSLGAGTTPGSEASEAAIELALALLTGPFARIDTSHSYASGRSEEVLGAARARLENPSSAHVVTKVDADSDGILNRDRVMRSYEASLDRLGIDRVELLHLHDPYSVSFEQAVGPGGALEGMIELVDSGAVDQIGIAAGPVDLVLRYVRTGAFDAVLTHNRYTLVDRSARPLLAEARRRGMTVFNAAPFGGGVLASGPGRDTRYAYRPAAAEVVDWIARVASVCERYDVALPAAALHFSLRSPLIDSTVVGVSSLRRLAILRELVSAEIPEELWHDLDELGPTPDPLGVSQR